MRWIMTKTPIHSVRHVARLYSSNKEATAALGIDLWSFGRICRPHQIETPYVRKRKRRSLA